MVDKNRLYEILNNFKNSKIAVVGDVMLDDYIFGSVDRISPEAPVPVINVKKESFVLGGAANVSNNLKSLTAQVFAFGVIGNDDNGKRFLNELNLKNINTDGIIADDKRPTAVKRRVIAQNQQLLRLDWEDKSPISEEIEDKLLEKIKEKITEIDAFILSDYDKGVLTESLSKKIIKLANENNKIITVDPKPKNHMNYVGATSITPNRKEALECLNSDKFENEEDLINKMQQLKEKLGLENLLLTRSEEGMTLFENGKVETISTVAKEVYDVTGAGDTVISVFTLAKVAGAEWYEAAKIANTAAGIVVAKMGTATATTDQIMDFYSELYHNE